MKRIIKYGLFILLINAAGSVTVNSQQRIPVQFTEKVILFSDRTLYIAGEHILFSALIHSGKETYQEELSRVLYCELITPGGEKITGNKYLVENFFASGNLTIPEYILTGNYYLRAYTKLMRNEGPSCYYHILIKIVNPNRSEVQAANDNNINPESLSGEIKPDIAVNSFLISTNKSQFSPRDTVHILIEGIEPVKSPMEGLSLAVVPEFSIPANIVKIPVDEQPGEKVFYYPETLGLSVTGKLTDNTTGNTLKNARINLSIIGKGREFMAMKTDSAGRFFFYLPDYTGSRDLFLCSENPGIADSKILVDNDFCTIPVQIPSNHFTLTPQEREVAYKMAINLQLESYFRGDSIPDKNYEQDEYQVFYGKPTDIIYIDKYVQLPTIEEYFNELPTLVKVRKRQGEKYFKILGPQTGLADFEPLVMVDMVAIEDLPKILAIAPTNISRIEVINVLYVKGDQIYGGIINIISKNGDFAGINLPSSGIFINYNFLSVSAPDPKIISLPHSPDTRNTLYWEPQFVLNKNNFAELSFMLPDTPGRYLVVLNGIKRNGETFRQTGSFEVLKQHE